MVAAQKELKLIVRHSTATAPQLAFWKSSARWRLFVAGVGSGKTRAGCVEVLRMPAGSTGAVIAPTYPMIRDATMRTFLELATKAGVLKQFNKGDMTVDLIDGKHILFRSSDDPDRLRGPNLGWAYLDEAALMDADTWLIMIGRLRERPGRAWATSTPRGFNWLYETFVNGGPDYEVIKSSTRQNPFLPPEFVSTLERSYTSDWQKQEIEGDFTDPTGSLFKRQWFETVSRAPEGLQWARYWDLAASTKSSGDYTAGVEVALSEGDGCLYIRDMVRGKWEWPDAKKVIMETMLGSNATRHGIEEAMHGLAAIQELRREPTLANITVQGIKVDRDKMSRALPWAARAEASKVKLVRGDWVPAFLDEVCSFPQGQHDDQVDTVSGGVQMVARNTEWRMY